MNIKNLTDQQIKDGIEYIDTWTNMINAELSDTCVMAYELMKSDNPEKVTKGQKLLVNYIVMNGVCDYLEGLEKVFSREDDMRNKEIPETILPNTSDTPKSFADTLMKFLGKARAQ